MRRRPVSISGKARVLVIAMLTALGVTLGAADLTPQAVEGWKMYVTATEERRAHEPPVDGRFLALDYALSDRAYRRDVMLGQIFIRRGQPSRWRGREIDVPSALLNHWVGAVFVPGVSLDQLLMSLRTHPPAQVDVLNSAVLRRDADSMTVFLRLRRTRIVTVTYDTEHEIRFTRVDAQHASSTSVATRIVQLENAGTSAERALPSSADDGYLWRLNAYWRYEAVPGGVMAECESLTLSRSVPFGLRTIAAPLINAAARESMEAALSAVRSIQRPRAS